jgi:hypothetical protein
MEAIPGARATALEASLLEEVLDTADAMALSKGLPGVFGVFAEPKEANAPEPRPKALEAPLVGDVITPGVVAECDDLPWDEVSPERFDEET